MCKLYRFLYFILPFKTIRSGLIKKHLQACEDCQETIQPERPLEEMEAVKAWAQKEKSLWPDIMARVKKRERTKSAPDKSLLFHPQKIWRWAAAFAALAVLVVTIFFIQKNLKTDVPLGDMPVSKSPANVVVKRAELKGKNARPIIYQTSTVSIIYLVEDKKTGG